MGPIQEGKEPKREREIKKEKSINNVEKALAGKGHFLQPYLSKERHSYIKVYYYSMHLMLCWGFFTTI